MLGIVACSAPVSGPDASDVRVQPSDTTMPDAPPPADVQEIDAPSLDVTPPEDATVSDGASDADQCAMGQTRCGATCVDTETSSMNCGACGMACPATQRCAMGRCGCAPSQTLCGGVCVDASSSIMHCGRCDNACAAGDSCVAGVCVGSFVATPPLSPVVIPASAGCTLLNDTNADQIDIAPDNTVWVVMRCGSGLRVSRSIDRARTFSAPLTVPFGGGTQAATLLARSSNNLVVLAAVGSIVESLTTTNGGMTWAGPSPLGSNFQSTGPGPALSIVEQAGSLFATYSSSFPSGTTSVFRAVGAGATWTGFGQVMLAGPNDCPDLFAWGASDLLLTNESGRQVFRSGAAVAGWGNLGTLGTPGGYTDFAHGGTFLYASSSGGALWRGVVTAGSVSGAVSVPVSSNIQRSMDADSAGNLAFAADAMPNINIVLWQAGASMPAPAITRTIPGASPAIPAIAAIPSGTRGAVLVAAGAAGVSAFVVLP